MMDKWCKEISYSYYLVFKMLSLIFRVISMVFDWRTLIRKLKGEPTIDVAFISNLRDKEDKKRFIGVLKPRGGFTPMQRYWLDRTTSGRCICIDSTAEELYSLSGRKRAREQFKAAVEWAGQKGAKVILSAASTKRLFGRDGHDLKEEFPEMIFTIGDNGTGLILKNETLKTFESSGINPTNSIIAVIAPYGILGEYMVKSLVSKGYDVVGIGRNISGLERVMKEYEIEVFENIRDAGKVDAIIACTHSEKARLNHEDIDFIRKSNRKLLVVDVAEPANLTREEYSKCSEKVIRIDAGNAYSARLKAVMGPLANRIIRLSKGVLFGCFSEAFALTAALKNGQENKIKNTDWFKVNSENADFVESVFENVKFTVPTPRCFGKTVKNLNLDEKRSDINPPESQSRPNSVDESISCCLQASFGQF